MSEVDSPKFGCPGCQRQYVWKAQLAGKKARCKCGQSISVPAGNPQVKPKPQPVLIESDMYDFADEEENPALHAALANAIPSPPLPALASPAASPAKTKSKAAPLGYQRGPTKREKERFSNDNLLDMPRDVYVPVALLAVGFILYLAYYCTAFRLSSAAFVAVTVGVGLITAFKTFVLIAFAFVIAGPVGVSFGGLWTAILKLAAVAVFCDGVASWVDYFVKLASGVHGTAGPFGFGIGGFVMAFITYLVLYAYLFGMDYQESYTVVRILSIFDRLVRWALFFLLIGLLPSVVSHSAAHSAAAATPGVAAAASDPVSAQVQELNQTGRLTEARKYIAAGNQAVLTKPVDDWYAAGCPNVWFEMSNADINGRQTAFGLIVELPADKSARATVFSILKSYYDGVQIGYDPEDIKDTGQTYLPVLMR